MSKITGIVKGFIIGAANIVPGISSGTLMIVFNIYDRFVNAANLFFKHPFKAIASIYDILIGFVLGIIGSFLLVSYTYKSFPLAITLLIIGLVFSGYKTIFEKIKNKQTPLNIIILIASALIVTSLPFINHISGIYEGYIYYIILIFIGLIVAFFLVAPGISGSLIILILGYYYHILDLGREAFEYVIKGQIKESLPLFLPIIILGISVIIGMVISLKLIKKIMDKHEVGFYHSVMGMLIGSPFAIIILLTNDYKINSFSFLEWTVGIALLLAAYLAVTYMIKIENGNNNKQLKEEENGKIVNLEV